MSIAIARNDEHAERWQQWQHRYGESSRRTAIRARLVLAIILMATSAWVALQIFLSV